MQGSKKPFERVYSNDLGERGWRLGERESGEVFRRNIAWIYFKAIDSSMFFPPNLFSNRLAKVNEDVCKMICTR